MMGSKAYAKKAPMSKIVTEDQNMILVNRPATSQPSPPVILHATLPFGRYINTPLMMSITAAPRNIHSLLADNGTIQGNIEIIEVTAAPPAKAATAAGSAQHINVPVEVNRARKLDAFCFQLWELGLVALIKTINLNLNYQCFQ